VGRGFFRKYAHVFQASMSESDEDLFPSLEAPPPEGPYASIHWNATTVCMDVHCECGEMTHIDADFCYHLKCVKCGRVYECDPRVRLRILTFEPRSTWPTES
jgi:hypothetical protein